MNKHIVMIALSLPIAMQAASFDPKAFFIHGLKNFTEFSRVGVSGHHYNHCFYELTQSGHLHTAPAVNLAIAALVQKGVEAAIEAKLPSKSLTIKGKELSTNDVVRLVSASLVYAGVDKASSNERPFMPNAASHAISHLTVGAAKAVCSLAPDAVSSRINSGIKLVREHVFEKTFGKEATEVLAQAASFTAERFGYFLAKKYVGDQAVKFVSDKMTVKTP